MKRISCRQKLLLLGHSDQGKFGIGFLSFWTLGDAMTIVSSTKDGRTLQMHMQKGSPNYAVTARRFLMPTTGTEVTVKPLLPGLRMLSGEKIQWYLASELRDRIRRSGVDIQIVDRQARKQHKVEPRQFEGRLLHDLPPVECREGDIYVELYMDEPDPQHRVELQRSGTRVLPSITEIDRFQRPPWSEGLVLGLVDVPFLQLTPGTRLGIIQDDAYAAFVTAIEPLEKALLALVEEQKRAQEERASRNVLRTIQKAFREALLALPAEEYDWFDIRRRVEQGRPAAAATADVAIESDANAIAAETHEAEETGPCQKEFFRHAGPLFSVRVSPASSVVPVNMSRALRALPRDRSHRLVEDDLAFSWSLEEGDGRMENAFGEIVTFHAPTDPGLSRIRVVAKQRDITCEAEGLITISDSLVRPDRPKDAAGKGMPDYSLRHAPGELWRSHFDNEHNLVLINKGHRDYVYASRSAPG